MLGLISSLSGWFGIDLYSTVVKGIFATIQYVTFVIGYFISLLATVVISLQAFFLTFVINLNFGIVNSPAVQIGFSAVLAFANILFVTAIIVMAVATIVRYNAYGVKQLLFKIVVAAVAVNFSLVIAGTAISFSDQLSIFFLSRSVPNPAATNDAAGLASNMHQFSSQIAGTFNPQRAFLWGEKGGTTTTTAQADYQKRFDSLNSKNGFVFSAILGVFITVMILAQIVIFLGVLIGAFFVRYVWLGLLLMIMPIVWVAWIFPFSSSYVRQWMSKFINWTFFGPLALFFLYLGMRISAALNSSHYIDTDAIIKASDPTLTKGLTEHLTDAFIPVMGNLLNAAMIGGALWGGLYLAHKLGIGAASTGMKAMESVTNSMKRTVTSPARFAGRQARKAGRAAVDGAKTGARNSASRNFDRLRTIGKDKDGYSWLQRKGSTLATSGSKSALTNTVTSALGIKAAGRRLQELGVADKATSEERAKKYDYHKYSTGDDLKARHRRMMSGSLGVNVDEERKIVEQLIAKRSFANYHNDIANKDELRTFMKRAKDNGYDKEVLKANPLMAQYAAPGQTFRRDKSGEIVKKPDSSGVPQPVKRNLTLGESVGNSVKGVKNRDELTELLASNPYLFGGDKDNSKADPTSAQIHAVKALGRKVNNIDDAETLGRVQRTIQYVLDNEDKMKAEVEANKKEDDFSDDANGLGLTDTDMAAFNPIIKELNKNVLTHAMTPWTSASPTAQGSTPGEVSKPPKKKRYDGKERRERAKAKVAAREAKRPQPSNPPGAKPPTTQAPIPPPAAPPTTS